MHSFWCGRFLLKKYSGDINDPDKLRTSQIDRRKDLNDPFSTPDVLLIEPSTKEDEELRDKSASLSILDSNQSKGADLKRERSPPLDLIHWASLTAHRSEKRSEPPTKRQRRNTQFSELKSSGNGAKPSFVFFS